VDLWDIFPFAPEVGYIGLALVSFIGSLIPFVPIPSFILLATMSVGEQFDIHILALISAFTATIAKQIIFYASYGGRRMISEKTKKRMKPFQKLVKRYGGAAAFVAAATPIPDDMVYIPLGLAKYNPKRFFVATLSGKIVLCYIIVLISHYTGLSILEPILEDIDDPFAVYVGIIVFGVVMTIIVVLLLRLDWERILGRVAPWTLDDDDATQN
jgi:membrane protein DedA with SNARE-associated domain